MAKAARVAAFFGPLLLVVACSSSGNPAQNLGQRLQVQLAPDLAAGNAVLEQFPDGARVTLSERVLFPVGGAKLGDQGRYVLASVIEGLLEPRILQVQLAESTSSPPGLPEARARAVATFFEDYGLGSTLQPAIPYQGVPPGSVGAAPQGVVIAINVVPR
jgi:flagellar motor protein MotB